jgi:hypothetical protein
MHLGSVGHVEEVNRSDLDSHADCCVCGKEVLVFNGFDREVTVAGWDPEGETQSLSISSNGLYNSRIRPNCAPDCTSEYFQPIFEPQSDQYHAN